MGYIGIRSSRFAFWLILAANNNTPSVVVTKPTSSVMSLAIIFAFVSAKEFAYPLTVLPIL
jgi:hypothetical protein